MSAHSRTVTGASGLPSEIPFCGMLGSSSLVSAAVMGMLPAGGLSLPPELMMLAPTSTAATSAAATATPVSSVRDGRPAGRRPAARPLRDRGRLSAFLLPDPSSLAHASNRSHVKRGVAQGGRPAAALRIYPQSLRAGLSS